MCKKLICLVSLALVLGPFLTNGAKAADPSLVGWWKFNDGSGTIAEDASNYGNHGAIVGNPIWVEGKISKALHFDGANDFVEIPHADILTVDTEVTVMAWINAERLAGPGGVSWQGILAKGNNPGAQRSYSFYTRKGGDLQFSTGGTATHSDTILPVNEWVHVAAMVAGGSHRYYVNGNYDGGGGSGITLPGTSDGANVRIGATNEPSREFLGIIDDVRIYSRALTEEEIRQAMIGIPPGPASEPSPQDEATYVPREVVLSWTPGEFAPAANGHIVYLSESFDDVNDGIGGITQSADSFAPAQRLDFETTYYWRVDEVNAPPDSTVYPGDVWSFTIEPIAYPVPSETVTATASSSAPNQGPENTVNDSGLVANDLHSVLGPDMWLSDMLGTQPTWIQYEFDKVLKLHEMWVWNQNTLMELAIGFGIKDATIEYSADGTNWTTLGTTHEFARGAGAAGYAPNTNIDFKGAAAKYVKLTANSNWGGILDQYGLSEVRFLSIPVLARDPDPATGATAVDLNVILSWKAGREAAEHNVYLSTDEQAVIDGTAPVNTVTETGYTPLVDLGETYYWRVDEVNDAETPTTWQGEIWSFSTQEYLIVEDFESYNEIPFGEEGSNLVYETWIDGFANPSVNGSTMGHTVAFEPSMETATVYDGRQSAPLYYDNSTAGLSEVTVDTSDLAIGRDWTVGSPQTLVLWVYGATDNAAQQMYVKVGSAKEPYGGDITDPSWNQWDIDLAGLGIDLSNVTTLSIGLERIGGLGGQGMILLDAIRLY